MKRVAINCFSLLESNGDGVSSTVAGFVSSEELAKEWVADNSAWRRYDKMVQEYFICETLAELEELQLAEVRKKALQKLTPAEIIALGL